MTTHYQKNIYIIKTTQRILYENESNKATLREHARNKYSELSNEQKNMRREYGRSR